MSYEVEKGTILSFLTDLIDGDGRAAGPDGGMYASLASSTTAAEMTPATGYAGGRGLLDRAQPVVADLHRRDGPGPDEEVLSEGWSGAFERLSSSSSSFFL